MTSQDYNYLKLTRKYNNLFNKIKQPMQSLHKNASDDILAECNLLFEEVNRSCTLNSDARVLTETINVSSFHLDRTFRTDVINTDSFIGLSNEEIESYINDSKRFYYGITFNEYLDLEVPIRNKTSQRQSQHIKKETVIPESSAVKEDVSTIPEFIKDLVNKTPNICYFKLVIDVDSYSKTVENMFYLATAIKLRMCSLINCDGDIKVTKYYEGCKEDEHLIVELDYNEYINLIKSLKLQQSTIVIKQ